MLQEFSILFSCEEAFQEAVEAFFQLIGQKLSVDTLEKISRRMAEHADTFLQHREAPPAQDEGELLVITAEGNGVPFVKQDAQRLRTLVEKLQRQGNRRMATLACVYSLDSVISELKRMASVCRLKSVDRTDVDTVCRYFTAHRHRMKPDEYLAAGCTIATGVIEGVCRHLVKDCLERSGMRWTTEGAQAMLILRSIKASNAWNDFQNYCHTTSNLHA